MSATTDEALVKVITGNRFASPKELEEARAWGQRFHPEKDLIEVLLLKGVLDKAKVGMVRRLAKLARRAEGDAAPTGSSSSATSSSSSTTTSSDATTQEPATGVAEPAAAGAAKPPLRDGPDDETPAAGVPVAEPVAGPTIAFDGVLPVPRDGAATAPLPVKPARADKPEKRPPPKAEASRADPRSPDRGASGRAPRAAAGAGTGKDGVKVTTRPYHAGDPSHVGRYEVLERVAKGGMGIVFKARHPELDRVFAVKVLTAKVQQSEEALARFQREAKIAARLDHANIVRVHDAGSDEGGAPYLVMDFVDGPSLEQLIKDEGLGVRRSAQLARSLALALHHAHERGVVHRDVKPDNIIIEKETSEPKITDFGIVKDLLGDEDERKLTQTGFTLGSPCYMSPEQAAGRHKDVGPTSDIYSLAATLYQMLTGDPPFDGDSIHSIMVKVVTEDPVPVRKKNQAVPPDLESICMKALEKEPGRRYATGKAFAEDLARFLAEEPVEAKPAGWLTKARRLARRHRPAVLVGLTVVTALAVLLGTAWRDEVDRRERAAERLRQALLDADVCLVRAEEASDAQTRRKAYYDAILHLEACLRQAPGHPDAMERKRRAVLALGDHLIESGEASFAEFVFSLGTAVADVAEIRSRVEAARMNQWVEAAQKAERDGDLDEALRLYREAQRKLREAGYTGDRLTPKVGDLEAQRELRRRNEEVSQLRAMADAAAAVGDHAGALVVLRRAVPLAPTDRELQATLEHHRNKAVEDVLRLKVEVDAGRAKARGVLGEGAPAQARLAVDALLSKADEAAARGLTARDQEDFPAARRELAQAGQVYANAYSLASALHARTVADQAASEADSRSAARFAPTELGRARELHARAATELERGRYEEALALFEQAASWYRQAGRTGSGKEVVAGARQDAQEKRARAASELTGEQRLGTYDRAEQDFSQAEGLYQKGEYGAARDLYMKSQERFARVLELAPVTREAFAGRVRVRGLRSQAEANRARDFAADDYQKGLALEQQGDQALEREDPAAAVQAYSDATYRYTNAVRRSLQPATLAREAEELRAQISDAQKTIEARGLTWKPDYQAALKDVAVGDEFLQERNWRLAKRRYESALRKLDPLVNDR